MWLCVDHYQSAGWASGCTHTRTHAALLYPAVLSVRCGRGCATAAALLFLPSPHILPLPSPPLGCGQQTRTYCSRIWRRSVESEVMMSDLMEKNKGHGGARVGGRCPVPGCASRRRSLRSPLKRTNDLITSFPKLVDAHQEARLTQFICWPLLHWDIH